MAPDHTDDQEPMTPGQKASLARPKWSNGLESKLALMASMVSPYDYIWMPLMLYYHGGGLVFIPLQLFFLALIGVPMLLLEVSVGQFTSRGLWCAWSIAPLFKGLGYLATIANGNAALIGFWKLMTQVLFCHDLATTESHELSIFSHCPNVTASAEPAAEPAAENITTEEFRHYHDMSASCGAESTYSSRWYRPYYFATSVTGMTELDGGQVLAMFLVILLVCGVVAAGRRVISGLSAVCVIVPYLLVMLLMMRVVTLPGAAAGLMYGFYPDWYQLLRFQTWRNAASAALFSMGAAQGLTLTAASHNRFSNNFLLDCLLAAAVKLGMTYVIAFTMLGAFGVLAAAMDRSFADTISGDHMVTIVTETLLLHAPGGGFWAACFLVCLLLSSLISAVWVVESVVAAVWDLLPHTPRFRHLLKKHVLVTLFAAPWLLYSITYCTKGALTSIEILTTWVGGDTTISLVCLFECAAVGWLFGARRFQACWAAMLGGQPCCGCPYPLLFWAIITPIVLLVMLIYQLIEGLVLLEVHSLSAFLFSLLLVVISGVVLLATRPGTFRQKWKIMTTPWDLAPHQMQPNYRGYETITLATINN